MFAVQHHRLSVVGQIVIAVILTLLLAAVVAGQPGNSESNSQPWWTQQKISYFWCQWNRYRSELQESHPNYDPAKYLADTERIMKNLAQVGATVFVRYRPGYGAGDGFEENQARLAHKYGMRYFAVIYLHTMAAETNALCPDMRVSVNREGKPYGGKAYGFLPCPLYRPAYEKWFVEPVLRAARTGLVDGLHMDWEFYGDRSEARVCYCDDCFGTFLTAKGLELDQPVPKDQRYAWLEDQGLTDEYEATFRQRRAEMFREFAQRIRQVKPGFIFAGYGVLRYAPEIVPGLHSPDAPFFFIDSRHYEDPDRWWKSLQTHYNEQGYLRIAGTCNWTLLGGQPQVNVSAPQLLYDLAINSDGYWPWMEEELTPDAWRSFWIANRMIKATEHKVGEFLLHGQIDTRFATVVEWTGAPIFDDKIIQRTYHLGNRHLVHLHNVHTDWPVRLRLRFPRLPAASHWLVTDPIAGATYGPEGHQAVWSSQHLRDGIVLSLPKRSELFLELRPTSPDAPAPEGPILLSDEGTMMPEHPASEASPPRSGPGAGEQLLAVTVSELLGYDGRAFAIGNAIHTIGSDGGNDRRLRQVKGYLWSPAWSPDGSRIAFVHYANGRGQIYAMTSDGSLWANLSSNNYCDRLPAWSPDGSKIAFVSDRDGDWEIFVMNADGTDQRQLTHSLGRDFQPVWSPDGRHIAFCRDVGGDVDIYIMDANGLGAHPVVERPGDQWDPAWSSDSSRIACGSVRRDGGLEELLVVNVNTEQVQLVMRMPGISCLEWSPDGTRLAGVYEEYGEPAIGGVFMIDAASPARELDWLGRLPPGLDDECKLTVARGVQPYSSDSYGGNPTPSWYSKGGASPRWVLKSFTSVRWSPDGSRLAFSSDMSKDGYFYVYVLPATGGEPVRLDATRSAWPQQISWCPK